MCEQWYCPNCGPTNNVDAYGSESDANEIGKAGDCLTCGYLVNKKIPPFVLAMQDRIATLEAKEKKGCIHNDLVCLEGVIERKNERIAKLEKVAEVASKMRYITRPDLVAALRAAGYLKEQGE